MNKFIIGLMMFMMIGCSNSNEREVLQLRQSNSELKLQLGSCKSRLEASESFSSTSSPSEPEPSPEPEPSCEENTYDILYMNGKKLDTCLSSDVERHECGVSATNCESGISYICLRDIAYKTETKKKCK